MASTSAIATKILTAPSGIVSATVSWSRSRESSLSIEAQGSLRMSRGPPEPPAGVARMSSSSASAALEKSGSNPRSIIARRAIRLRVERCRPASVSIPVSLKEAYSTFVDDPLQPTLELIREPPLHLFEDGPFFPLFRQNLVGCRKIRGKHLLHFRGEFLVQDHRVHLVIA